MRISVIQPAIALSGATAAAATPAKQVMAPLTQAKRAHKPVKIERAKPAGK